MYLLPGVGRGTFSLVLEVYAIVNALPAVWHCFVAFT